MEHIVITQFSDPMMGLSWECEPALARIEQAYGGRVEFRDVMGVLDCDMQYMRSLGFRTMPAFLVQCDEKAVLINGVASHGSLQRAIAAVQS